MQALPGANRFNGLYSQEKPLKWLNLFFLNGHPLDEGAVDLIHPGGKRFLCGAGRSVMMCP